MMLTICGKKIKRKRTYQHSRWIFQTTNRRNVTRKENLKCETKYLLIAAQNNTIRTNNVKAKIDLKDRKCTLCGDRDWTVNLIISGCSILTQRECKIRHNLVWWGRWSTGNCARNWKLTTRNSGICTTLHPY